MDMYPHEIRLRGPWHFRTISSPSQAGTLTVPGFWHHQKLADYRGKVELSRSFNWVAERADSEVVWLVLDKVVGTATISLNGQRLGDHDSPWDTFRFDVTHLLETRNRLVVELDAFREMEESPRFGLLGCTAEDPEGERRHPIGGILGGVHLAVESRRILPGSIALQTGWGPAGGSLELSAQGSTSESNASYVVTLRLDGQELYRAVHDPVLPIKVSLEGLAVQPWWPRPLGDPSLSTLELVVGADAETLYERSWRVGFRSLRLDGKKVWCNEQLLTEDWQRSSTELYANDSFRDCFGEEPSRPFEQWRLAQYPCVEVRGHVPPESFFRLCDRAGLLAICDLGFLGASATDDCRQVFNLLCWHPSTALVADEFAIPDELK